MREIKFRVWDKFYKRMDEIDGSKDVTEQYKMMQYTGLKDSNDVKIFEDDIVIITYGKHYNEPKGLTRVGKVYWNKINAAFEVSIINSAVTVKFWDIKKIKIIGNIYDNLELIK